MHLGGWRRDREIHWGPLATRTAPGGVPPRWAGWRLLTRARETADFVLVDDADHGGDPVLVTLMDALDRVTS
jgi:hypothetical protein